MILEISSLSLKMSKVRHQASKRGSEQFFEFFNSQNYIFPKFEKPKCWIWLISDVQNCLNSNFGQNQRVKIRILTKSKGENSNFGINQTFENVILANSKGWRVEYWPILRIKLSKFSKCGVWLFRIFSLTKIFTIFFRTT